MADLVPIIAYPPVQKKIKLEIQDEPQEENNNVEEENLVVRLHFLCYLVYYMAINCVGNNLIKM